MGFANNLTGVEAEKSLLPIVRAEMVPRSVGLRGALVSGCLNIRLELSVGIGYLARSKVPNRDY